MAEIEARTGFNLGEIGEPLLKEIPTLKEIQGALKPMILSASGWRKIFALSGDEESKEECISKGDTYLAGVMAEIFTNFVQNETGKTSPTIVLALDARFTGPALANPMIRVFLDRGVKLRYAFIAGAPEIMGYTGQNPECDAFVYISASHNPIGHNGVKFGLSTGGVLDGSQAKRMIQDFEEYLANEGNIAPLCQRINGVSSSDVALVYSQIAQWKEEAEATYFAFSKEVICGQKDLAQQDTFFNALREQIKQSPLGVVAELNGSARTLSIDKLFLDDLGVQVQVVNGTPRQITHRIVPEGASLNLCREELEKAYGQNPAFQLGYVPDNDGDRGNLVYINQETQKAEILEAQEVFALSVLSELAYLDYSGLLNEKTGVGINGPTSMRIDDIAKAFNCQAFRAEVGEANVVNLSQEKRELGWQIRILGEGSNGGNITYPAAVRDPLNTLGALLKLLTLRSTSDKPGLFELWCQKSGQLSLYKESFTLVDVLKSLPQYVTTSAYEPRALMKISSTDHKKLKANYETIFASQWAKDQDMLLMKWGIVRFEEWNQEGTRSLEGIGPEFRSGAHKGGLTIKFFDVDDNCLGFIWMRGSGTEPVFRVLCDWKGESSEGEEFFLEWHKSIIAKADQC